MVYESDFYTVRRPYSRPTLTSYTVTGTRPVITIRTLIPPSNLHSNVRMSVLLGELNRIQHRSRPRLGKVPMEDYLCSRPMIEFDDEAKLIRTQADRLMRYIYTKVPTRERHPFGVLTTYDRHHYTVPDDRYSSPKYLQYHRDIPSNILNMSYYYEPSRVTIGRGHLSCVSYAGGRGYPRRKHLYSDENRDIGDEIRFRSYYNKIMNPKSRAEALLLPTGFASRLLLTERNRYDPQEDSRLLFITPIKKSSGVSKERKLEKKKIEAIEEKPRNSTKSKKEIKENEKVEKIVPSSKLIAKSPEPEENVECSATVRITPSKSHSKSPQPQQETQPEPEPEPEPVKEPEPEPPKEEIKESKKPSKKAKKDSKVSERLDSGPQKEEAESKAKEPEPVIETVEAPKQEVEIEKETPKEEPETEKETPKEESKVEELQESAEPSPSEVVEAVPKEEIVESSTPEVQEPVTPVDTQVAPAEEVEVITVDETPSESKQEDVAPAEETAVPQPEPEPEPEQVQKEEIVEEVATDSKPEELEAPAVVDESEPNIPDTSNEPIAEAVQPSEEIVEEPKVEELQEENVPVAESESAQEAQESIPAESESAESAPVASDTEAPAESEVISSDPVVE